MLVCLSGVLCAVLWPCEQTPGHGVWAMGELVFSSETYTLTDVFSKLL